MVNMLYDTLNGFSSIFTAHVIKGFLIIDKFLLKSIMICIDCTGVLNKVNFVNLLVIYAEMFALCSHVSSTGKMPFSMDIKEECIYLEKDEDL